jgi:cell division protein FtsB
VEFSFDRSRSSNTSTNQGQQSQTDDSDTSKIANERLRKAIERNRARQRSREATPAQASNADIDSVRAQHQAHAGTYTESSTVVEEKQAPLFEERSEVKETPREIPREVPREEPIISATRKNVARPDETEFIPIKRSTKKVASHVSYTTGSKRKPKELNPVFVNYLVKGTWLFCGFLVLRLFFSSGGVVDYYNGRSLLNNRVLELKRIKKENMALVSEIERMQLDASFQKKLVRDNLGFIAADEYLVLFPKD